MKKILLIIILILAIFQMVAISANLFSDGFEGGNLNAWDANANDSGDLSVSTAAKLHGVYGLSCLIDDNTAIYVTDETPNVETRYRWRFYINPNSLSMAPSTVNFMICQTVSSTWATPVCLYFGYTGSDYWIKVADIQDGVWISTSNHIITNGVHCIEVDWKRATDAATHDGFLSLWIDGVLKETLANLNNDTEDVTRIDFGACNMWGTLSGTLFLDDFQSNNDGSVIGMLGDNAIMFGINF